MATVEHADGEPVHGRARPAHLQDPDNATVYLLGKVWDRLNRRNEHFMGAIVGREGSGKSHTAIRLAAEVDPTFDADRVLFDVADLLKILRDGEHEPGQVYVLDEAGVSMGRRTWQERGQILANQALQLIRDHNLGLIFTLPRLGELDSQAVGRLHAFFEIMQKREGEHVRGKWKWIDPDRTDTTGTVYKKLPEWRRDGRTYRITSIAVRPPADALVKPYEARKDEFQREFYDEVLSRIDGEEEAETTGSSPSLDELQDEIRSTGVEPYLSWHGAHKRYYLSKDALRDAHDLSHSEAKRLKDRIDEDPEIDVDAAAGRKKKAREGGK